MVIRKVTRADDFDALSRIYALSWKAAYKGIIPRQYLEELSETHWSEALASGRWVSLAAIDGGRYVGTSAVCPARDEAMRSWGEIVSIYLLPECFGRGYGRPLLNAATAELAEAGYDRIYLWVLEANARARAFYEKNGFTPTFDKIQTNIGGEDLTEMRYILRLAGAKSRPSL